MLFAAIAAVALQSSPAPAASSTPDACNRHAMVRMLRAPDWWGPGTGSVGIEVDLDAAGTPVQAKVLKPSGLPGFDEAAFVAATTSQYTPRIVQCQAVPVVIIYSATYLGRKVHVTAGERLNSSP